MQANRPGDFGAMPGDGQDDSKAFAALFEAGGQIEIPPGVWDFDASVIATLRASIDVSAAGAIFKSHGIDGDLFRLKVSHSSPGDLTLAWQGGTFDIRDQKNSKVIPYVRQGAPVREQGEANTADALSIRGVYQDRQQDTSSLRITSVTLAELSILAADEGADWRTAGGDSGLFLVAGEAVIRDSFFHGLRDDAIYLSADGLLNEVGGNYTVENVTISGSVKGIAVQRGADNVTIRDSRIADTAIGIVVDGTDDGRPKDVTSTGIHILDNEISGAWLAIRLNDARDVIISGNKIHDLRPFEYVPQIGVSDLAFGRQADVVNLSYINNSVDW